MVSHLIFKCGISKQVCCKKRADRDVYIRLQTTTQNSRRTDFLFDGWPAHLDSLAGAERMHTSVLHYLSVPRSSPTGLAKISPAFERNLRNEEPEIMSCGSVACCGIAVRHQRQCGNPSAGNFLCSGVLRTVQHLRSGSGRHHLRRRSPVRHPPLDAEEQQHDTYQPL